MTDRELIFLIVGAAGAIATAMAPVLLAAIAGYVKLREMSMEQKQQTVKIEEQTVKIEEAAKDRKEIAATQSRSFEDIKQAATPQPVVVANEEPVKVQIKEGQ